MAINDKSSRVDVYLDFLQFTTRIGSKVRGSIGCEITGLYES